MCGVIFFFLHLLICTALRAHIIVVEALYKINYYYYLMDRQIDGYVEDGLTDRCLKDR